mmetsp:Transcript_109542/g.309027  ORF Transcript_109542/g.309027 Transcript_109542/m.309027 type:complete len:245 (+) Transcript_109542:26-760(+)
MFPKPSCQRYRNRRGLVAWRHAPPATFPRGLRGAPALCEVASPHSPRTARPPRAHCLVDPSRMGPKRAPSATGMGWGGHPLPHRSRCRRRPRRCRCEVLTLEWHPATGIERMAGPRRTSRAIGTRRCMALPPSRSRRGIVRRRRRWIVRRKHRQVVRLKRRRCRCDARSVARTRRPAIAAVNAWRPVRAMRGWPVPALHSPARRLAGHDTRDGPACTGPQVGPKTPGNPARARRWPSRSPKSLA